MSKATITKVIYDLDFGVLWKVSFEGNSLFFVKDGDSFKPVDLQVGHYGTVVDMYLLRKANTKAWKAFDKFWNGQPYNDRALAMKDGDTMEIEV